MNILHLRLQRIRSGKKTWKMRAGIASGQHASIREAKNKGLLANLMFPYEHDIYSLSVITGSCYYNKKHRAVEGIKLRR